MFFRRSSSSIYLKIKVFKFFADIIKGKENIYIHYGKFKGMNTKLLFYSAIIFFILAIKAKDGVLYYFFAVHLITLAIVVFLYKFDKNSSKENNVTPLP